MENIVRECKKRISKFRGNMDAAIAAGLVDGNDSRMGEVRGDEELDSEDEDHVALMANLTNTQAFARAMNLDLEQRGQDTSADSAYSRLQTELQTVENNVDAINCRIRDLNNDISSNQGTQKRMLTQLLSQQLSMESQMRSRLEREREREGRMSTEASDREQGKEQ